MSGISGKISGTARIMAKLGEVQNLILPVIREELEVAAFAVQRDARKAISSTKGSRKQTRYNPKRTVTVSPAGSAPNTDLGKLVSSIQVDIDAVRFTAVVGTNYKPGKYLELGTKEMRARPFLFPAFEGRKAETQKNFREAFKRAFKEAGRAG